MTTVMKENKVSGKNYEDNEDSRKDKDKGQHRVLQQKESAEDEDNDDDY